MTSELPSTETPEPAFVVSQLFYPELSDPVEGYGRVFVNTDGDGAFSLELAFTVEEVVFDRIKEIERYSEVLTDKVMKIVTSSDLGYVTLLLQPTLSLVESVTPHLPTLTSADRAVLQQAQNWVLIDVLFDEKYLPPEEHDGEAG